MQKEEEYELNEAELEKVLAGIPLEAINDIQPEVTVENVGEVQVQPSEEHEVVREDNEQKEGFFKKMFNRIKTFFQKDVKRLPEGKPVVESKMENVTTTAPSQRETFLKDIQDRAVSNEGVENDELSLDELDKVTIIPPTPEKGEDR